MVSTLLTNIASYYKLDENAANTSVSDELSSDDGISSVNTSDLYSVSGKVGSCFDFDATSSEYININDLASTLNATTTGSWSLWMNTADSTPSAAQHMIMFGNSGANVQLYVALDTTGKISVQSNNGGGNDWALITDNKVISDNTWHHIVVVQNGTSPVLYVDGSAVDITVSGANTTLWFHTTTFNVGSIGRFYNSASTSGYFDGKLDEIGFWTRGLTSLEVTELNNSGSGLTYPFISASAPTVSTTGTSLIEETTASVSGNVTDGGTETVTERGVAYGSSPNPTIAGDTEVVAGTTGTFTANLTGLTEGEPYYARAYATNSVGTGYGADIEFSTKPLNATGIDSVEIHNRNIVLDWTNGVGAEKTEVRRKLSNYPNGPTDGDRVYFDTGTTVDDTGLTASTPYYYRAWGWDTDSGYSDGSSSVMITTLNEYLLTTTVSPVASGTITPSPSGDSGYYEDGTSVSLTAAGTGSYEFSYWSNGLSGSTNPEVVIMSSAKSVTGNFITPTSGVLQLGPNQYAQSNVVYNNATPVTRANLTAVDTGDIDYYMASYDGTTEVFEQVVNGTDYTFINSGNKVKWRAVESAGASATVTHLKLSIL